jgi:hypothetical protein
MHPQIEKLIELALADGQVTEKERNVILKKAVELGIDTDEVEMVLDGRLHQLEASKPKEKEKVGNIKTCPACGASVKAFQIKCDDCGHEFNKKEGADVVKNFALGYNSFKKSYKGSTFKCFNCKNDNVVYTETLEREIAICYSCSSQNILNDNFKKENIYEKINYISSFNIPHDKEGVLSILFYFFNESNKNIVENEGFFISDDLNNKKAIKEAFKAKFLETYEVAKILLISDPIVTNQINQMKDDLYKNEKTNVKRKLYEEIGIYILAAIMIIAVALMIIFDK